MPSQEDIKQQQELLDIYRRRLAYNVQQWVTLGIFAPFSLTEDIQRAVTQIQQIKDTLLDWNVEFEDKASDNPLKQMSNTPITNISDEMSPLRGVILGLTNQDSIINKHYFDQFIEPIWEAFTKIHKNYKMSFSEYIKVISTGKTSLEPLIEKIRHDSIFTADLRTHLWSLIHNIPAQKTPKGQLLSNFIEHIGGYFGALGDLVVGSKEEAEQALLNISSKRLDIRDKSDRIYFIGFHSDIYSNIYREAAVIYLSKQGNSIDRVEVCRRLDEILYRIQLRYSDVVEAYQQLRTELIS